MATAHETSPIACAASGRDFRGWIEILTDDVLATGMFRAEGWVFSPASEIDQVRAVVGQERWIGQYGLPRPDVGTTFPEISHAVFSGFTIFVPVPANGTFELRLQAQNGAEKFHTFFRQQISLARPRLRRLVRSSPQNLYRYEGLQRGYVCWIDEPRDWNRLPRRFRLAGWCFAKSGAKIEAIRARVGTYEFTAKIGIFRPDVAISCGDSDVTFKSGFGLKIELPRQRSTLRLEARHDGGEWREIFSRAVRPALLSFRTGEAEPISGIGDYKTWIRLYDTLSRSDQRKIENHILAFPKQPLISIVMPVYNPAPRDLRDALRSVCAQLYPNWQLCIVDDASTNKQVRAILTRYARLERRITVKFREKNGGIAVASNDALALGTGEWIALMDHDDRLALTALYFAALEINEHPEAQLIYTDEDKLDRSARRYDPHFKSDWNYDLLLSQNYISHLSFYRRELIDKVGGFRQNFEGAQDYDLTLRCAEQIDPSQIRHIPRVLYHWRAADSSAASSIDAKPHARESALRAVQEHLDRHQIRASVEPHRTIYQRVKYELPADPPLVSIIIPTRDRLSLLRMCIQSILDKTNYPNYEIVVIDNDSVEPETKRYLDSLGEHERIRVCKVEGAFSFGKVSNRGVDLARGSFIVLLNNDIEVIDGSWLGEMVGPALRKNVGAVGALLRYPNGLIQHGGVILGAGGIASHAHPDIRSEDGYFCRPHLTQDISAVTAACMLVRKETYLKVGGFDEVDLPVAFNDVDFCLRLRQAGFLIVWTPHAELYHHESASRGLEDNLTKYRRFNAESDFIKAKWREAIEADPYHNPNLSLSDKFFRLAFPPRVQNPWQRS